jgi:hypothetical protein
VLGGKTENFILKTAAEYLPVHTTIITFEKWNRKFILPNMEHCIKLGQEKDTKM